MMMNLLVQLNITKINNKSSINNKLHGVPHALIDYPI